MEVAPGGQILQMDEAKQKGALNAQQLAYQAQERKAAQGKRGKSGQRRQGIPSQSVQHQLE